MIVVQNSNKEPIRSSRNILFAEFEQRFANQNRATLFYILVYQYIL